MLYRGRQGGLQAFKSTALQGLSRRPAYLHPPSFPYWKFGSGAEIFPYCGMNKHSPHRKLTVCSFEFQIRKDYLAGPSLEFLCVIFYYCKKNCFTF